MILLQLIDAAHIACQQRANDGQIKRPDPAGHDLAISDRRMVPATYPRWSEQLRGGWRSRLIH
jgi:hypothetical protein